MTYYSTDLFTAHDPKTGDVSILDYEGNELVRMTTLAAEQLSESLALRAIWCRQDRS